MSTPKVLYLDKIYCIFKLFITHKVRTYHVRLLDKQEGLINIKLTFTFNVHGAWDGVMQELDEMDDFKT